MSGDVDAAAAQTWAREMVREDDYYGGDVSVARESEWLGDAWHARYAYEDQIALEWKAWGRYGSTRLVLSQGEAASLRDALTKLLSLVPREVER